MIYFLLYILFLQWKPIQTQPDTIKSAPTMPLTIAHRGLSGIYPENTMISFRAALEAGADGLEGDLRYTSDNQIILLHDDTLDRTTNCTGPVSNRTYASLANCNANYASVFGNKYGFVPIPLFSEVVELISVEYDAFWVLDLKVEGLGALIAPIAAQYKAESRLIMSCWTPTEIANAVQYMPSSPRQFLTSTVPNMDNDPALWSQYLNEGVRGFSISVPNITREFVSHAHARLLSVVAWTVDDIPTWTWLSQIGVDGIITNRADLLVNWTSPIAIAINQTIAAAGAIAIETTEASNTFDIDV